MTDEQREYADRLLHRFTTGTSAFLRWVDRRPLAKTITANPSPLRELTDDCRRRFKAGEISEQEYRAELRAYVRLFGPSDHIETDEEIEHRDTAQDYALGTYNG